MSLRTSSGHHMGHRQNATMRKWSCMFYFNMVFKGATSIAKAFNLQYQRFAPYDLTPMDISPPNALRPSLQDCYLSDTHRRIL